MKKSFAWQHDFPPVFGHTSIAYLKRCPGYEDAKNGDMAAALAVVSLCVKPGRLAELRRRYPKARLLPVVSGNKLPEAFAIVIGLKSHTGVYLVSGVNRKSLSAMQRLLHSPDFAGKVAKRKYYILVDDVVTQGGTVSALRRHVIVQGGTVVAIAALACAAGGGIIAPSAESVLALAEKLGYEELLAALRHNRVAADLHELTRSQVKYLLRFKNIGRLNKRLAA